MKPSLLSLLLLPAVLGTAFADVSLQFSSYKTADLIFQGSGDQITFSPDSSGFDFQISNSTIAGLDGLLGKLNGTFTIGTVVPNGPLQEAPVTGMGTFSIYDGVSSYLTANIWWRDALTVGPVGALNSDDLTNVSNISYSGTNAALEALAANSTGTNVVSFQFSPSESLMQLTQDGAVNSTSYSGAFTAVPEPASSAVILGVCALLGTAVLGRRPTASKHRVLAI